jgi:DNA-binding Lrp family transcriptional regulator
MHKNTEGVSYPSYNTILHIAGLGSDTVFNSIEALKIKGYIKVKIKKSTKSSFKHNTYIFPKYKQTSKSEKFPNVILMDKNISKTEKVFLLRLLPFTFNDLSFKLTRKEMIEMLGMTEKPIKASMASLTAQGYITGYSTLVKTGKILKSGTAQVRPIKCKRLDPVKWLGVANYVIAKQAETIARQKLSLRFFREENEELKKMNLSPKEVQETIESM